MSCLKISSIYVCKDTLWVGTSAGLIVNIKIPFVNNVTTKLSTPLIYNGNQLYKINDLIIKAKMDRIKFPKQLFI